MPARQGNGGCFFKPPMGAFLTLRAKNRTPKKHAKEVSAVFLIL
jgi:hypothetical protein